MVEAIEPCLFALDQELFDTQLILGGFAVDRVQLVLKGSVVCLGCIGEKGVDPLEIEFLVIASD